jgi:DNA alkylation repair enzyme
MPAIDLARLKTQAARLSDKFGDPEAFVQNLNEVLDYYTNRTIRPTQTAQRLSLPTYHTPAPVLRQIQSELNPLVEAYPKKAIELVNALWKEKYLEARVLAAWLLGSISPSEAISSLAHLPAWLAQSTDKKVREMLLTDSLTRLRQENPEALFAILEEWLKSPRGSYQVWGLQALIPIVSAPHFENLPVVFRILRPTVQSAGPLTQLELKALLATLEHVSLTETVAFLRDLINSNPSPIMIRTLQRIVPGLSAELQSAFKTMLREA